MYPEATHQLICSHLYRNRFELQIHTYIRHTYTQVPLALLRINPATATTVLAAGAQIALLGIVAIRMV